MLNPSLPNQLLRRMNMLAAWKSEAEPEFVIVEYTGFSGSDFILQGAANVQ
jgi:hypothetical protein